MVFIEVASSHSILVKNWLDITNSDKMNIIRANNADSENYCIIVESYISDSQAIDIPLQLAAEYCQDFVLLSTEPECRYLPHQATCKDQTL